MKRRSFLAAIFAAPSVATITAASISKETATVIVAMPEPDVDRLNCLSAGLGQFTAGTIRFGNGRMLIDEACRTKRIS